MAIKVNVRKLIAWHNDLADEIRVEKLNEVAEDFAREIINELGDLQCESHIAENSYITIIADRTHTMVIEKHFCCGEFEGKIGLKIER